MKQMNSTTHFNRRDFMKLSGMMASGLMLSHTGWASAAGMVKTFVAQGVSAPYLAPVFILEQATRLGLGSSFIHAGLKYGMTSDIHTILPGNAFRMGVVMPFGKEELMSSFAKLKTQWNAGQQDQAAAQRLAVLSGAMTSRGVMKEMGQVADRGQTTDAESMEQRIYQDATLISNYLYKGVERGEEEKEAIHDLFRQMLTRTFIRFHTLMPDEADGAAWLNHVAAWRKQNDRYYGELATAIARPDETKQKKYITGPDFFDGNDFILKQVSPFERIAGMKRKEGEQLLASAADGSICAKALASGYRTLIALSDYMSGDIGQEEVEEMLGIS